MRHYIHRTATEDAGLLAMWDRRHLLSLVDDLAEALRGYHDWLAKVGAHRGHYFGLDHGVGENNEGCTGCHALARLEEEAPQP